MKFRETPLEKKDWTLKSCCVSVQLSTDESSLAKSASVAKALYKGFLIGDCERGIYWWTVDFISHWFMQHLMICAMLLHFLLHGLVIALWRRCLQQRRATIDGTRSSLVPCKCEKSLSISVLQYFSFRNTSSWECKNFSAIFEIFRNSSVSVAILSLCYLDFLHF